MVNIANEIDSNFYFVLYYNSCRQIRKVIGQEKTDRFSVGTDVLLCIELTTILKNGQEDGYVN